MAMDKDLNPMTTSADTRGMGMKAIQGAQLRRAALVVVGLVASLTVSAAETFEYIHTDALGSPVAVTDANGVVIERMVYEPYGAVVNGPVKDGPGYTGHVADSATGLSYMQQRYMDPEIGRFLSVDPVGALSNGPGLFNRFRYGRNNPYKYTDPDGRVDWGMVGDAFKVEGGLALGLTAKAKIGPAKLSAGLGAGSWGGGFTLAPDVYGFQEVAGPSLGLEMGNYGVGYKGSVERSYEGRNGKMFSEESSKAGVMFGRKKGELAVEQGGTNGEVSVSVGFIGKLTVAADLGKVVEGLVSPNKSSSAGQGSGFKGVFRVDGRLDSRALDRKLNGGR